MLLAALPLAVLLAGCGGAAHKTGHTGTATSSAASVANATATPAMAILAITPSASATALQQRLEGALLGASDLPAGFGRNAVPPEADFIASADATAVGVYSRAGGGGPGAEQIVVSLFGFRDALSAADGLGQAKNAVDALTTLPGATAAAAAIPNPATVGDATQTYRIAGSLAGVAESGFAVYWRRGSVVAGVAEFGSDATLLPDAVDALAQKQDARLMASGL